MKTPSKKQYGPAWLANLETTSTDISPRPTTSREGSAVESTRSKPSRTIVSPPELAAGFNRKQWLTQTSFADGELIAGCHVSQWNTVRLRRTGNKFMLTRNGDELLGK